MIATQQIYFRQLIDIAADGLRCNDEQLSHFLDADVTAFADQLEDLLLTGRQISMGLPLGCRAKFAHDAAGIHSLPVTYGYESVLWLT